MASPAASAAWVRNASLVGTVNTDAPSLVLYVSPSFSADIKTGSGTLTLLGGINTLVNLITVNGVATNLSSSATPPATISGNLDLEAPSPVINVATLPGSNGLLINANITSQGGLPGLIQGSYTNVNTAISAVGALPYSQGYGNPGGELVSFPIAGTNDAGWPWTVGNGPNNTDMVYSGQVYCPNGYFGMGGNCDDLLQITINGVTLASAWPAATPYDYYVGPGINGSGWDNIDIRFSNGGGGYGPTGGNNWPVNYGIGITYLPGYFGITNQGGDYVLPYDASGTLFRTSPMSGLVIGGTGRTVLAGTLYPAAAVTVQSGELMLSGNGSMPNETGVTINSGALLTIDNNNLANLPGGAVNLSNRLSAARLRPRLRSWPAAR